MLLPLVLGMLTSALAGDTAEPVPESISLDTGLYETAPPVREAAVRAAPSRTSPPYVIAEVGVAAVDELGASAFATSDAESGRSSFLSRSPSAILERLAAPGVAAAAGDVVRAHLPGIEGDIDWAISRIDHLPDGTITAVARVVGDTNHVASFVLGQKGNFYALMSVDGVRFDVRDDFPGYVRVSEGGPEGGGAVASDVDFAESAARSGAPALADGGAQAAFAPPTCPATATVDLMVITTPGALKEARNLSGNPGLTSDDLALEVAARVALVNAALSGSGVPNELRLVHVEHMGLSAIDPVTGGDLLPMLDDWTTPTAPALIRCSNNPSMSGCGWMFGQIEPTRDYWGADLLFLYTDDLVDHDGAVSGSSENQRIGISNGLSSYTALSGCDQISYGLPDDTGPVAMGVWKSGWNVMAHELGHVFGAGHFQANANTPFSFARPFEAPDCTFTTIMGNKENCSPSPNRNVPFYSSPCVRAGVGGPVGTTGGQQFEIGVEDTRDNARAIVTSAPLVAQFRSTVVPDQRSLRSQITSVSPGALLGTSHTFTWNDTTPTFTDIHTIEIGTTVGGQDIAHSGWLLGGTDFSYAVSTLPATNGSPIYVRLWSLLPPVAPTNVSAWDFRDFRYDVAGVVLDCTESATILAGVVPDSHIGKQCDPPPPSTNGSICSFVGGVLTCDLDDGNSVSGNRPWAMASTHRGGRADVDVALWGGEEGGAPFCCLFKANGTFSELKILGTQRGDDVALRECYVGQMSPPGTTTFTTTVQMFQGPDVVFGSNSTSSLYHEVFDVMAHNDSVFAGDGADDKIFGSGGNDILDGEGGVDWIEGGDGNDVLEGGDGADTLQGNLGADELWGGDGGDVVCDITQPGQIPPDILRGEADNDFLFNSAASTTDINAHAGTGSNTCSSPRLTGIPGCSTMLSDTNSFWTSACPAF